VAVLVVVVARSPSSTPGSAARAVPAVEDRWNGVDQRDELAAVVAVAVGAADR
jgi:hypothetical protein